MVGAAGVGTTGLGVAGSMGVAVGAAILVGAGEAVGGSGAAAGAGAGAAILAGAGAGEALQVPSVGRGVMAGLGVMEVIVRTLLGILRVLGRLGQARSP